VLSHPSDTELIGYMYLPHSTSIQREYHTSSTLQILQKLIQYAKNTPCWTILDAAPEMPLPEWQQESFLYLFTHAFDTTAPICLGSTGKVLPTYILPLSEQAREDVYRWMSAYRNHDNIWFDSGTLEIPSYKELVEPESELSRTGRTICNIIEQKTGIPTYYYLNRYWGRKHNEQQRVCPGCGQNWKMTSSDVSTDLFSNFPFRCDQCRLVSRDAVSFDDERHARLGEYKKNNHNNQVT